MRMSTRNRPDRRAVLIWAACLLFLSRPLPAAAAFDNETHPTNDRVTLPDGATIELLGVSEYATRQDRWWQADGTPLPKPPSDSLVFPFQVFSIQSAAENRLKRAFVFNFLTDGHAEIDGPDGPEGECHGQVYICASRATPNGPLTQRHLVAAIRRAARIDLAVDYENGEWRTVATSDGREDKLGDRSSTPQVIWESRLINTRTPEIWVAHNLDLNAEQLWLIAVDEDNVPHQPRQSSESVCGHVRIRMAMYPDVPIGRVKEYRLATHLTDRRIRFKPDANVTAAAPSDDVVWGAGAEESDAATISAACRIHKKKGRIIAIGEHGREWMPKFGEHRTIGNFCQITAQFPGLPLARVQEFRFQTRTHHHHIEFRNVSLHAGQKNPAQIYLDGKRYVPKLK
jgi:hypothetical protein